MNKVAAIVQARVASTRLPGKVLMDICGKPMLERVIDRVKEAKLIDGIIVATTENSYDRAIVDMASRNGVSVYVGKEDDVLDRYYCAAVAYHLNTIVRITSDCPLIDSRIIDKSVRYLNDFDYVTNTGFYPDGLDVEVFSYKTLQGVWIKATNSYDREHVTSYIRDHPKEFKIGKVRRHTTKLPNYKWSVDTIGDLEFVREIYTKLGDKFGMDDILNLLKEEGK